MTDGTALLTFDSVCVKEDVEEAPAAIYEGDENPARGNWSGKLDFMMSTLGYAVGKRTTDAAGSNNPWQIVNRTAHVDWLQVPPLDQRDFSR